MTTCKPSMQVPTSYKLFLNRVSSEVALLSFYTNAATDTNMNSPVPSVGIMCCLDAVYTKLERKNRCWGHRETFNCLSNKLHLHPHDWVSPLSTFLWHKIKKKKKNRWIITALFITADEELLELLLSFISLIGWWKYFHILNHFKGILQKRIQALSRHSVNNFLLGFQFSNWKEGLRMKLWGGQVLLPANQSKKSKFP